MEVTLTIIKTSLPGLEDLLCPTPTEGGLKRKRENEDTKENEKILQTEIVIESTIVPGTLDIQETGVIGRTSTVGGVDEIMIETASMKETVITRVVIVEEIETTITHPHHQTEYSRPRMLPLHLHLRL